MPKETIRTFSSGANRTSADGKLDYEGHLSPIVLERYVQFLDKKRRLADGTIRPSDNWQRGIPKSEYLKSGFRHFMDVWKISRGYGDPAKLEEATCGVLFNMHGFLFELLHKR